MPWRIYQMNQKYTKLDGTVSIYRVKNKKWVNSKKAYKPQKRGFEKQLIYSKRFGYLDLYNRKEQQNLKCPSGHSISQCFHVLSRLWYGYRLAKDNDKSVEQMQKYAKAIQGVQEDMGIATTSFPHLGIYGDSLVLNDKKGNRIVFEDHSALKKKQEEYEKWQAENAKKIQEKLLKSDKSKGEVIETFADDTYPFKKQECEETVPELLKPDEEEGEEILVMIDDTPFQNQNHSERFAK
jgi:hypothetical protein